MTTKINFKYKYKNSDTRLSECLFVFLFSRRLHCWAFETIKTVITKAANEILLSQIGCFSLSKPPIGCFSAAEAKKRGQSTTGGVLVRVPANRI